MAQFERSAKNMITHPQTFSRRYWFRRGAICAILAAFPIAVLFGLFYRFPIPLVGYLTGTRAVLACLVAVVFYGIVTGGFVILGLLGGAGSWFLSFSAIRDDSKKRLCVAIGCIIAFLWAGTLAIFDKLIGPW